MKKLIISLCFAIALLFGTAAQGRAIGIGVILGEPTGLSLRIGNFPILGIAWSLDNYFHFHMDWWIYSGKLAGPLDWYFGIGGKLSVFDANKQGGAIGLGIRVPFGIDWFIIKPLEFFAEIVPGLALVPATGFDIDGAIGLRFHF